MTPCGSLLGKDTTTTAVTEFASEIDRENASEPAARCFCESALAPLQ